MDGGDELREGLDRSQGGLGKLHGNTQARGQVSSCDMNLALGCKCGLTDDYCSKKGVQAGLLGPQEELVM